MRKLHFLSAITLAIGLFPSIAQPAGEFKGYMFGDYYYLLNHHNENIEGRHGFWFRRIYFTYDNKLSDNIKMRLRLEFNSPGDFTSSDKPIPILKDAFLSSKLKGQELQFGIISTPSKVRVENIWGFRAVEKTPLDLHKLVASRDFGVAIKGNLDKEKKVSYMVMFGNGAANKGETDKGKKIYASLAFEPTKALLIEAYGDFEVQADDKTYYVYQGFASYQGKWGRIGSLYGRRHLKQKVSGKSSKTYDYDVFSAFAVVRAAKEVDIIARYDRMFGNGFESNYTGHKISYMPFADNPGGPINLIIGGISWQVAKAVWVIPHIKRAFYGGSGNEKSLSGDTYTNLTLYFKF